MQAQKWFVRRNMCWYSANLLDDDSLSVEEVISLINKITLDDVVKAAGGIKLHTVYRLLPKEAR